jgi:hypothetical protein
MGGALPTFSLTQFPTFGERQRASLHFRDSALTKSPTLSMIYA